MTTVTSETAASVTVGLNIGSQAGENVKAVFFPLSEQLRGSVTSEVSRLNPVAKKWTEAALQAAASSISIFLAFYMKQAALTLSSCYLGSKGLLTVLAEFASPVLEKGNLEIDMDSPIFAGAQLLLTFVGFFSQLGKKEKLSPLLRLFLAPFDKMEATLRLMSARSLSQSAL